MSGGCVVVVVGVGGKDEREFRKSAVARAPVAALAAATKSVRARADISAY